MSDVDTTENHGRAKVYPDIRENPLHDISQTSFVLGIVLGLSIALLPKFDFVGFPVYIISLCIFHFLEFYITARYNPTKVDSDSFLLKNGSGYTIAQLLGLTECIAETYFFNFKHISNIYTKCIFGLGVFLLIMGQLARSMAMVTCGNSFNHRIMKEKEDSHVLITNGIYQYSRHPSYFGFFWWAVGTQIICLNPISTVIFSVVLWSFFNKRIKYEEKLLIQFFGQKYLSFQNKVSVGIPCIR